MQGKKVYIIAGEASGDNIGAKLMRVMDARFYGIGGRQMQKEGLEPLFPMQEISLMGFVEVLPKLFAIKRRIRETVADIVAKKPDVLVTIDSFGFNKRVVASVREILGKSIKIVNYVAPTVWAYKPQRAYTVARLYDMQLTVLPFEKPYFDAAGVNTFYVGHPVVEDKIEAGGSRADFGIDGDSDVLLLMVGSREMEVKRLAPIFAEALKMVRAGSPKKVVALLPTLPNLEPILKNYFQEDCIISSKAEDKPRFFSIADTSLVKSGTSSVEMMQWGIPCAVAYKVNIISYLYIKALLKVKYASIVNIILNKEVIPEFIQSKCTPANISKRLLELMGNQNLRRSQKQDFAQVMKMLGAGAEKTPAEKAAESISSLFPT